MTLSKERQRLYAKLWYRVKAASTETERQKHLANLRRHFSVIPRSTPEEKCRRRYENQRYRWIRIRTELDNLKDTLYGKVCYICYQSIPRRSINHLHRKDGKVHNTSYEAVLKAIKSEPDGYVRLCHRCHKGVHWCMKKLGLMWLDIISLHQALDVVEVVSTETYPFVNNQNVEVS